MLIEEVLELLRKLEAKPGEEDKLFFFELDRALQDQKLQIYYIDYANLLKLVADSKLPQIPDPAVHLFGFSLLFRDDMDPMRCEAKQSCDRRGRPRDSEWEPLSLSANKATSLPKRLAAVTDKYKSSVLKQGYFESYLRKTAHSRDSSHRASTENGRTNSRRAAEEYRRRLDEIIRQKRDISDAQLRNESNSIAAHRKPVAPKNRVATSANRSSQEIQSRHNSASRRKNVISMVAQNLVSQLDSGHGTYGKNSVLTSGSSRKESKAKGTLFFRKESKQTKNEPAKRSGKTPKESALLTKNKEAAVITRGASTKDKLGGETGFGTKDYSSKELKSKDTLSGTEIHKKTAENVDNSRYIFDINKGMKLFTENKR